MDAWSPPPAVTLAGAEKIFDNGIRALAPIDLAIRAGEFVSLIGPSGCGKSTVLKLAARLHEPSAGTIAWWRGGFDRVGEARIVADYAVDEPQPRDDGFRASERFALHCRDLSALLRQASDARWMGSA